jgi:hypothetical protein
MKISILPVVERWVAQGLGATTPYESREIDHTDPAP